MSNEVSSNTDKTEELMTCYLGSSVWYFKPSQEVDDPLPFCLEDVHDWWIKWDTLFVQHTPGSECVEYEPYFGCGDEIIKRPDQIFLDDKECCK